MSKGGTKGVGTRLMWKRPEVANIVTRAVQLRKADPQLTVMDSIYRAQGEVLPPERQKKDIGWYLKPKLTKRILDAEKDPAYVHPADPMTLVAAPPAPEPAAPAPIPEIVTPPDSPLTILGREFGAAFGAALVNQFAPVLVAALKEAFAIPKNGNGTQARHDHLAALFAQHSDAGALPTDYGDLPEKFHRHKIAVIGLLGSQQTTIKQSFPWIDFRWVDGGAKGETVKNVTKQCEAAFVMTKFVRHQSFNSVPMDKRVPVNGGVTDLTRLIQSRFPRSTSMEARPH